jgi:ATP/maltotriose-dependent transcriptional regulator MalT
VWGLNRGAEAVQVGERALAMIPPDDPLGTRPLLRAWLARMRFLRGRFREAAADAEVALEAAVQADDCTAQSELLNTLGMAQIALGQVEEGIARLRRAIELGERTDDYDTVVTAYSNLADLLSVAGRTKEGLSVAREGIAVAPRHLASRHIWMSLTVSELALEAGDWDTAREYLLWSDGSRLMGTWLIFRLTREADLALGEGDEDRAEVALAPAEELVAVSAEPQWIGMYGALLGELRRRRGDLDGAREAVDDALDRLELCTDDVMRIARVTAVGLRAEVDRAQRARDLRDRGELRDTMARVRIHLSRHQAAAHDGGPVERAYLATAKAEMTRAQGKPGVSAWARAVTAWEEVERPYPAAIARWRESEAQVVAGDRAAAAASATAALDVASALGSHWLAREVRALAERARLGLGADSVTAGGSPADGALAAQDPFGLTPRERQVLSLLAEGATNRQIGEVLFMAEKTASVHVSRILAKLGVQGRTQAAAVAHRQHLA